MLTTACLLWAMAVGLFAKTGTDCFIPASDSYLFYMGRVSRILPDVIRFTYPGVSIWADFEGTSLRMKSLIGRRTAGRYTPGKTDVCDRRI